MIPACRSEKGDVPSAGRKCLCFLGLRGMVLTVEPLHVCNPPCKSMRPCCAPALTLMHLQPGGALCCGSRMIFLAYSVMHAHEVLQRMAVLRGEAPAKPISDDCRESWSHL